MKETFNEDFRWGLFAGVFVTLVIIMLVTSIYKIGNLMAYDDIINQCESRNKEFQIYEHTYTCQAKDK